MVIRLSCGLNLSPQLNLVVETPFIIIIHCSSLLVPHQIRSRCQPQKLARFPSQTTAQLFGLPTNDRTCLVTFCIGFSRTSVTVIVTLGEYMTNPL
jgi:hypothetical protein